MKKKDLVFTYFINHLVDCKYSTISVFYICLLRLGGRTPLAGEWTALQKDNYTQPITVMDGGSLYAKNDPIAFVCHAF